MQDSMHMPANEPNRVLAMVLAALSPARGKGLLGHSGKACRCGDGGVGGGGGLGKQRRRAGARGELLHPPGHPGGHPGTTRPTQGPPTNQGQTPTQKPTSPTHPTHPCWLCNVPRKESGLRAGRSWGWGGWGLRVDVRGWGLGAKGMESGLAAGGRWRAAGGGRAGGRRLPSCMAESRSQSPAVRGWDPQHPPGKAARTQLCTQPPTQVAARPPGPARPTHPAPSPPHNHPPTPPHPTRPHTPLKCHLVSVAMPSLKLHALTEALSRLPPIEKQDAGMMHKNDTERALQRTTTRGWGWNDSGSLRVVDHALIGALVQKIS